MSQKQLKFALIVSFAAALLVVFYVRAHCRQGVRPHSSVVGQQINEQEQLGSIPDGHSGVIGRTSAQAPGSRSDALSANYTANATSSPTSATKDSRGQNVLVASSEELSIVALLLKRPAGEDQILNPVKRVGRSLFFERADLDYDAVVWAPGHLPIRIDGEHTLVLTPDYVVSFVPQQTPPIVTKSTIGRSVHAHGTIDPYISEFTGNSWSIAVNVEEWLFRDEVVIEPVLPVALQLSSGWSGSGHVRPRSGGRDTISFPPELSASVARERLHAALVGDSLPTDGWAWTIASLKGYVPENNTWSPTPQLRIEGTWGAIVFEEHAVLGVQPGPSSGTVCDFGDQVLNRVYAVGAIHQPTGHVARVVFRHVGQQLSLVPTSYRPITLRLFDAASGVPLVGSHVSAEIVPEGWADSDAGTTMTRHRSAVTDADGICQMPYVESVVLHPSVSIPTGSYGIIVTVDGFHPQSVPVGHQEQRNAATVTATPTDIFLKPIAPDITIAVDSAEIRNWSRVGYLSAVVNDAETVSCEARWRISAESLLIYLENSHDQCEALRRAIGVGTTRHLVFWVDSRAYLGVTRVRDGWRAEPMACYDLAIEWRPITPTDRVLSIKFAWKSIVLPRATAPFASDENIISRSFIAPQSSVQVLLSSTERVGVVGTSLSAFPVSPGQNNIKY